MKKIFVITIILMLLECLYGQRVNYYFFSPKQLQNNVKTGWLKECSVISLDFSSKYFCYGIKQYSGHDMENTNCMIYSKFIKKNNEIILKDNISCNKIIMTINDSSIVFKNNSKYFKKGDTFYVSEISNDSSIHLFDYRCYYIIEDMLYNTYWKNGIKNGINFKISNNKKIYLYYKDNILVDSLKVINEFNNDSVDLFIRRYYRGNAPNRKLLP